MAGHHSHRHHLPFFFHNQNPPPPPPSSLLFSQPKPRGDNRVVFRLTGHGLAGQKPQPGHDPLSLTGRVRQAEPVKVMSRVVSRVGGSKRVTNGLTGHKWVNGLTGH